MPNYEEYLKELDYQYNNTEELINNRINGLESKIKELKLLVSNFKESERQLLIDVKNADKAIKDKNTIVKSQKELIEKYEKKLKENNALIDDLQNEINELNKFSEKLESDNKISIEKLNGSNRNALEKFENKIQKLKKESETLRIDLDNSNEKLSEAHYEIQGLSKQLEVNEKKNSDLSKKLDALKQQKESIDFKLKEFENFKKSDKKLAEVIIEKDQLINDKQELETKFDSLSNEKSKLDKRISNLNKFKEDAERVSSKLDLERKTTDDLRRKLNHGSDVSKSELSEIVAEKDEIEKSLNDLRKTNKNLSKKLSAKSSSKWIFRISIIILLLLSGYLGYYSMESDRDVQYWFGSYIDAKSENEETFKFFNSMGNKSLMADIRFYNTSEKEAGLSFKSNKVKYIRPKVKIFSLVERHIKLKYISYSPSGKVDITSVEKDFRIQKGVNSFDFPSRWGYADYGKWTKGDYKYVFYLDGDIVAEKSLNIY
jgi:uncharacterized coiled-coil DUF342 family protein